MAPRETHQCNLFLQFRQESAHNLAILSLFYGTSSKNVFGFCTIHTSCGSPFQFKRVNSLTKSPHQPLLVVTAQKPADLSGTVHARNPVLEPRSTHSWNPFSTQTTLSSTTKTPSRSWSMQVSVVAHNRKLLTSTVIVHGVPGDTRGILSFTSNLHRFLHRNP